MWKILLITALLSSLRSIVAQPLAGGGGGGGGFGGGRFDDGGTGNGNDYDTPTCPPHCHSCSTDDVCDLCYDGYKLMHDGSCAPCPPGCKKCDLYGPEGCDACRDRHVLVVSSVLYRQCEPCAGHCMSCHSAGPGACDEGQCDWGYLRDPALKTCEACTNNCGVCKDTTVSGCLECKAMYKLVEGSCVFDVSFLAKILVTVAVIAVTIWLLCEWFGFGNQLRVNQPGVRSSVEEPLLQSFSTHENFIAGAAEIEVPHSNEDSSTRILPSGVWRGYYTHSGARHDVCEFTLEFRLDGSATGGGVDDVGEYTISGMCNDAGSRLAFTKTYVRRSQNVSGVVSYGNQGHSVEYRGQLVTGEGGALGGGFRGDWAIRNAMGNYNGNFHLWPAMEGWQDPQTEAADEPHHSFEAESECVVCFERAITTTLRPCGHQILCMECANQLRSPQTCPICRARISHICERSET